MLTFSFQFCHYLAFLLNFHCIDRHYCYTQIHPIKHGWADSIHYRLPWLWFTGNSSFSMTMGTLLLLRIGVFITKRIKFDHVDLKTTAVWSNVAITKHAHTSTNQWCLFCSHNAYTICSRHPNKQSNNSTSYLITQWTQHTVAKKHIHISEPRKESEHPWVLDMVKRWASSSQTVSSNICRVAQVANILHSACV